MYSPALERGIPYYSNSMALVAYNASRALLPALASPAAVSVERAVALELANLVKFHALSSTVSNIAQAAANIVKVLRPHITSKNVSAVRSAANTAVQSYWRATGNSHPSVVGAPANFQAAVRAMVPLVVSTSHQVVRQPNGYAAFNFANLIRDLRSHKSAPRRPLVGVELNPGPKKSSALSLMRNGGVAVSYGNRIVTGEPRITMGDRGRSCRIKHRELYDASVPGSTTFGVQDVIQVQPGLATTFPWLAPQAVQWEQYICHGLKVYFISISPTSTAGTISVSPSYDASDPDPTTEQQLSNAVDTTEESVWKTFAVPLRFSSMMALGPRRFVRQCAMAGDIKTFDVGIVYIATNNCANTNPIGKIWLEYDFEFFVPQNSPSNSTVSNTISWASLLTQASGASTTGTVVAYAAFTAGANPLRVVNTAGAFVPPAGTYLVTIRHFVIDTTNEALTSSCAIYNNASGAIAGTTFTTTAAAVAVERNGVASSVVVYCDGTTSLSHVATNTFAGAAGNVSLNNCFITFQLC